MRAVLNELARMHRGDALVEAVADHMHARTERWAAEEAADGGRKRSIAPRSDPHWRRRAIANLRNAGIPFSASPAGRGDRTAENAAGPVCSERSFHEA